MFYVEDRNDGLGAAVVFRDGSTTANHNYIINKDTGQIYGRRWDNSAKAVARKRAVTSPAYFQGVADGLDGLGAAIASGARQYVPGYRIDEDTGVRYGQRLDTSRKAVARKRAAMYGSPASPFSGFGADDGLDGGGSPVDATSVIVGLLGIGLGFAIGRAVRPI